VGQSKILDNYIDIGINNSQLLKQENLEIEKALLSIEIAKSNYSPKISFAPNYSIAAGGRRLQFPIGDLLNPVYGTLNQLTQSDRFPLVQNVNELLAPNNFHDTKFSIQYPLFNSDIKSNIALQKELLTSEFAKKKFIEYELKHQIEIAYFQYLLSHQAIKIYEESKSVLENFALLNQKLVKNEVVLKDALLTAEYEITKIEQQIVVAKKNSELAQSYFNFLINSPFSEEILVDSTVIDAIPNDLSSEFLIQSALENRPEFEQFKAANSINMALLNFQTKNAKLPQFFIGGNAGFQGFGYSFNQQAYTVMQIGMNWDIFHGFEKKRKIEQTKIASKIISSKIEDTKNQIFLQIFQAKKEFAAAKLNYESTKGGIEKTQKILQIVNSKYQNGIAINVEVSKAQNDYLTAKLTEALAKNELWLKYAQLKKVSGI